MPALQSILRGEIKQHVEYRKVEFRSYNELRANVMGGQQVDRKYRSKTDPTDTNQAGDTQSCQLADTQSMAPQCHAILGLVDADNDEDNE